MRPLSGSQSYLRDDYQPSSPYHTDWPEYDPDDQIYFNLSKFFFHFFFFFDPQAARLTLVELLGFYKFMEQPFVKPWRARMDLLFIRKFKKQSQFFRARELLLKPRVTFFFITIYQ